jgi:hypothetical protein
MRKTRYLGRWVVKVRKRLSRSLGRQSKQFFFRDSRAVRRVNKNWNPVSGQIFKNKILRKTGSN